LHYGGEETSALTLETWQANQLAVGDAAKAVCLALSRLGKRCTLRWIYRQCQPTNETSSLDYYGSFWRWFEALWRGNRQGAEFLFEDFRSRVLALREGDDLSAADWYAEVALCEGEHSEAIRAAILNRDVSAIKKELSEDIAAKRRLLALVEARARILHS
jgi:hypothetical protein